MNKKFVKCIACSLVMTEKECHGSNLLLMFGLHSREDLKKLQKFIPLIPSEFRSEAEDIYQQLNEYEKKVVEPLREKVISLYIEFISKKGGEFTVDLNRSYYWCKGCHQDLKNQEENLMSESMPILEKEEDVYQKLNQRKKDLITKTIAKIPKEKYKTTFKEIQKEFFQEAEDYIKSILNKHAEREREENPLPALSFPLNLNLARLFTEQ